jgi:hypothetical protein
VPLVDVYSALSGTSGAVRAGLQIWLRRKMEEVADSNNTSLLDKYQAYYTCLTEANCSRLQQYAASSQPPPQVETSCKTVKTMEQPETRDGSRITVEASTIHVVDCPSMGEIYVYEYHNRSGFRVIKPGDWGHAIGGKDFPTMAEAMNVAAGQIPGATSSSTTSSTTAEGGSNPQTMTLDVNGHSNTIDLATNKITSSGVIHGSDAIFEKLGQFRSAKVQVTTDKPLPPGWSLTAATCCSVTIQICKSEPGASSCSGTYEVPTDWPGVDIVASITKAGSDGKPIGSGGAGVVLQK